VPHIVSMYSLFWYCCFAWCVKIKWWWWWWWWWWKLN